MSETEPEAAGEGEPQSGRIDLERVLRKLHRPEGQPAAQAAGTELAEALSQSDRQEGQAQQEGKESSIVASGVPQKPPVTEGDEPAGAEALRAAPPPPADEAQEEGLAAPEVGFPGEAPLDANKSPESLAEAETKKITDPAEQRLALEALLFVAPEALTAPSLGRMLGLRAAEVRQRLAELSAAYEGRAFQLVEVAGGYRLMTRPEVAPYLARLRKQQRASRLSEAAMDTLAIIAYKQPISRNQVETIRGFDSSGTIKTLLERGLIEMQGRATDQPGNPLQYGTTRAFLEAFGLGSTRDLPRPGELQERGAG